MRAARSLASTRHDRWKECARSTRLGIRLSAALLAVALLAPAVPSLSPSIARLLARRGAAHAQDIERAVPDREHLERLAARASARIRALQAEADELASRDRSLLVRLRELDVRRQLKREELARLDGEIGVADMELHETTTRIAELEQTAIDQRPEVEARLAELYKLGRPRYTRLLLGVDDLRSIGRAYRMVSELADLDQRRIEEHRQTLAQLRETRDTLEERRAALVTLQDDAQQTRRELDSRRRGRDPTRGADR